MIALQTVCTGCSIDSIIISSSLPLPQLKAARRTLQPACGSRHTALLLSRRRPAASAQLLPLPLPMLLRLVARRAGCTLLLLLLLLVRRVMATSRHARCICCSCCGSCCDAVCAVQHLAYEALRGHVHCSIG